VDRYHCFGWEGFAFPFLLKRRKRGERLEGHGKESFFIGRRLASGEAHVDDVRERSFSSGKQLNAQCEEKGLPWWGFGNTGRDTT